jgi:hypothetical protein
MGCMSFPSEPITANRPADPELLEETRPRPRPSMKPTMPAPDPSKGALVEVDARRNQDPRSEE